MHTPYLVADRREGLQELVTFHGAVQRMSCYGCERC